MSTAVTIFNLFASVIKFLITTTINVVTSTKFNKRAFVIGFTAFTSFAVLILLVTVGYTLMKESTGIGMSRIERIKKRRNGLSIMSKLDTASLMTSFASLALGVFYLVLNIAFMSVPLFIVTAPLWVSFFVISIGGFVLMNYSDSIMSAARFFHVTVISPLWAFIMIIGTAIVEVVEIIYPIQAGWNKFFQSLPFRLAQVALICLNEIIPEAIQLAMLSVYAFISAITKWITIDPLVSELPLLDFFTYLLNFASITSQQAIDCGCQVLKYIINGAIIALRDGNLPNALTSAVNMVWMLASLVIIQPVISLFTLPGGGSFFVPQFNISYYRWISTLDYTGMWLQNATTIGFDIWIVGGNGTIISMVNGSLPMPTDNLQYLIRALQSQWARLGLRTANLVAPILVLPFEVWWQFALIAQNLPSIALPNGNAITWDISAIYNETVFISDAIGTVIETIGQCNVQDYPLTPFSQLSVLIKTASTFLYSVWQCFFGEIYYSVNHTTWPGIFTDGFVTSNTSSWAVYKTNVAYLGVAYGCLLAYLNTHLGTSFQGVAETVLFWLFTIPVELLGTLGAIFSGGSATLLDGVQVDEMELSLLKIATIGGLFYVFEPGANDTTCPGSTTLMCNLGLGTQKIIGVAARLIVSLIAIFIQFIKWITGSIQQDQLQQLVIPPDIACNDALTAQLQTWQPQASCAIPVVEDFYDALCNLGAAIGAILPISVGCMSGTDNFCNVHEFPVVRPNQFVSCTATFMCKTGRIIGFLPNILLSTFNYVIGMIWTNNQNSQQGGDNDTNFLVNIFQKVMNQVIFDLLGWVCPFCHVLDCLWSILLYGGTGQASDGPFSQLGCLITAFMVVLIRDLGAFVVLIIQFVIFLLSLLFGVPAIGTPAQIGQEVANFFVQMGTIIKNIGLLLLTVILQALFNLVQSVCGGLNQLITAFGGTPLDCAVVGNTLDSILAAIGTEPLDSPANRNYKREWEEQSTFDVNTVPSGARNCTRFFISPAWEQVFYRGIANGYPAGVEEICADEEASTKTFPPTKPPMISEIYSESNKKTPQGSFTKNQRDNILNTAVPYRFSVLQEIIMRHFGPGTANPDDMLRYMHEKVYWAPGSSCQFFFERSKDKNLTELGPADQVYMADCVRYKYIAVSASGTIPVFSIFPEDILYNPVSAIWTMMAKILRIAIVAVQFFFDMNVSAQSLFTQSYQRNWKAFRLDISFYNDTLLPIFQSAANPKDGANLVYEALAKTNFTSYLKRNYPSLYATGANGDALYVEGDSIFDPLKSFLEFASQISKDSAIGAGINSQRIYDFRNATYGFFFNYTSDRYNASEAAKLPYFDQPENVRYRGVWYDYHNQTQLRQALGEDVVRAMNSYRSTKSLYSYISYAIEGLAKWVASLGRNSTTSSNSTQSSGTSSTGVSWFDPRDKRSLVSRIINPERTEDIFAEGTHEYNHTLLSASSYAFKESIKMPGALLMNGSKLMDGLRAGFKARLESFYQSPAFEKELTPGGSLIANIMYGFGSALGVNKDVKVLPPWCVAKAARAHNLTFAQVRAKVHIQDCQYYDRLSFTSGNLTYDDFKKQYYKPGPGGLMIPVIPPEPEKTFFEKYLPALNPQAMTNRMALWNIGESIAKEIWAYAYVFVGTNGTALDRLIETSLGLHPSFSEYQQNVNVYQQVLDLLPESRRAEIMRTRYIRYDDHDVWNAWDRIPGVKLLNNVTAKFKEAALVKKAIYDEHWTVSRGSWEHIVRNQQQIRNKLFGLTEGRKFKEFQEVLMQAAQEMQLSNRGTIKSDLDGEMTRYNKFHLLQSLEDDLNITFLNLSFFFTKECYTSQAWLCEQCYVADAVLGRILQITNFIIGFYTNDLPEFITEQSAIIDYFSVYLSGNNTAPVARIGTNKNSQPRFPNLGEPIGIILQWSPNETANGLDWFAWMWPIIGGKLDALVPDGDCHQMVYNYSFSNNLDNNPSADTVAAILAIIQVELGWNICGVVDTFMYIVDTCLPAIGTWLVDHIFLCNYTTHIDGTARTYSLSAGSIVIGIWVVGLMAAISVTLYLFGFINMVVLVLILGELPFVFLVLVYNWCVFCFPLLPAPLFNDIVQLLAYTPVIGGPCSIAIGSAVNDTRWNANTCAMQNVSFSFANGADLGFTNPLNLIQFAKVAYGIDWGVFSLIEGAFALLFGDTTATFTYSDYNTNAIRHANYTFFFIIGVATYTSLAAFFTTIAAVFVFAALGSIVPLMQSFLIALFTFLKFIQSIRK